MSDRIYQTYICLLLGMIIGLLFVIAHRLAELQGAA